ncbi:MAG: UDP-3-O-(3-hydroxymyristoyl)glucosamine N-acyltransferase [Phycisphaerae bacterium]|nr:UDP-3-O-(3-hydroxymyristoyl)glucosamine N-acyltransferase [Phycisphaerae bacterium]
MIEQRSFTIAELASLCGATLAGAGDYGHNRISRVATLSQADETCVTWIANAKYATQLATTRAGAVIGPAELVAAHPRGMIVQDADAAVADVLEAFYVELDAPSEGVHPTAIVHSSATIGERARIGAYAVIGPYTRIGARVTIYNGVSLGRHVTVGEDSVIHARCVIYDSCTLGRRVIIHAGTVIGADGFGYIFRGGQHRKLKHIGTVEINDDVEIGANCCVDRGKLGPTRIGRGCKIDNLVQIAHNVQLGPLSILVAQCGIAGSAQTGTGVVIGGQAGIRDGITLGDRAQIAARTGVMADVDSGQTVLGNPAQEHRAALREIAAARELPQLLKRVAALEKRVKELDGATND